MRAKANKQTLSSSSSSSSSKPQKFITFLGKRESFYEYQDERSFKPRPKRNMRIPNPRTFFLVQLTQNFPWNRRLRRKLDLLVHNDRCSCILTVVLLHPSIIKLGCIFPGMGYIVQPDMFSFLSLFFSRKKYLGNIDFFNCLVNLMEIHRINPSLLIQGVSGRH